MLMYIQFLFQVFKHCMPFYMQKLFPQRLLVSHLSNCVGEIAGPWCTIESIYHELNNLMIRYRFVYKSNINYYAVERHVHNL